MQYESIEKLVKGKTAFITGGTSGIGKACVEVFCAAGVNVVTIGRNVERGKTLELEINSNGAYISCANCLPVCEYLVESGRHICLIASDIFDEMRQYIANGVIDASIYQNPFSQGYEAVKNLYYYLAEKREVPEQLLAHPQIILKSNMMLF